MKTLKKLIIPALALCGWANLSLAQQPLINQYYQNRYFANPAFAGLDEGILLSTAYRQSFTTVTGAPVNQALAVSVALSPKVGLGINIMNDKVGLLRTTLAKASYAYHLPLSSDAKKLSFGLSAGLANNRIDVSDISSTEANDPAINEFNNRGIELDGDFGMAYTDEALTIQTSLPNIRRVLKSDAQGLATLYNAISYKFDVGSSIVAEPMLSYLAIERGEDLVGLGTQIRFNDKLQLTGYYHSNNAISGAVGYNSNNQWLFQLAYNSVGSNPNSYNNQSFELGLNYRIGKRR